MAALALFYGSVTRGRIHIWATDGTIYEYSAMVAPENPLSHCALGAYWSREGVMGKKREAYRKSLAAFKAKRDRVDMFDIRAAETFAVVATEIALADLGLAASQREGLTGVWVQADVWSRCPRCRPEDRKKPAKIAAIGVKVDARGISRHGFALNVDPDMSYWEGIIACGLAHEPVAALADLLNPPPEMGEVKAAVVSAFLRVFGYTTS